MIKRKIHYATLLYCFILNIEISLKVNEDSFKNSCVCNVHLYLTIDVTARKFKTKLKLKTE